MNKNIGIVSVFFDRGSGRIALDIKQALQCHIPNANISILARMSVADNKKQIKYWDEYFHENILLYPEYKIEDSDFEQWIKANNLSTVIFVEEQHGLKNLVSICNKLGIQSINYLVWEFINPAELQYYQQFTYLVAPTKCTYKLLTEDYLLTNVTFVPWGMNLDVYQWQEPIPKQKPIIFFPAGYGGVYDRKNEKAVIAAFSYICPRDKALLHIHTQCENQALRAQNVIKTSGTVDTNQLINYYKEADLTVSPSRWEGNGLPQMESLALGRPIIVPNAPPMNEKIIDGETGYLIKVKEFKEVPGIFCKSAEVDIEDFASKMIELSENKEKLYEMQMASRRYAETNLSWFENSKNLIDILA